jgi:hypothetical protein
VGVTIKATEIAKETKEQQRGNASTEELTETASLLRRSNLRFHRLWLADNGGEFFAKIASELACARIDQAAAKLREPAADISLCRILHKCRSAVGAPSRRPRPSAMADPPGTGATRFGCEAITGGGGLARYPPLMR